MVSAMGNCSWSPARGLPLGRSRSSGSPMCLAPSRSTSAAGFEVSFHDDSYAFAHRDLDLTIHLALAERGEITGAGALYIHCQDADRVAIEWREVGIEVQGPQNEDYGIREGSITDPDGNLVRFGSPTR